jgi:hypothetical protein
MCHQGSCDGKPTCWTAGKAAGSKRHDDAAALAIAVQGARSRCEGGAVGCASRGEFSAHQLIRMSECSSEAFQRS